MTLKGGTSQACAACKYQRRRCTPHCQLAPYFPADQPKMFQNAHRLFGVSNILKILKQLDPSQKMMAMRCIIIHANVRDKNPVSGCYGIIQDLLHQIQLAEEELQSVLSQLNFYKQNHSPMENNNDSNNTVTTALNDSMSQLQLGLMSMSPPPNTSGHAGLHQPFFHHHQDNNINTSDFQFQYVGGGGSNINNNNTSNDSNFYVDSSKENDNNNNNNNNNNVWIQQSFSDGLHQSGQLISTNLQPQQEREKKQEQEEIEEEGGGGDVVVKDYDDIHPFFDTIDDRQSYIHSKEAYESSSESSLKRTTQTINHVGENELKSAAAYFSLTSVN